MSKDNIKKDVTFLILLSVILILITSDGYSNFFSSHIYLDGFIKFGALATMGELLSNRIICGMWKDTKGLMWRIVIWGIFGSVVALMFTLFSEGVMGAQRKGMLLGNNKYLTAFFISATMNSTSGPVMMAIHRIGTTYIDLRYEQDRTSFKQAMEAVDWFSFLSFEVFTTTPLIWIPANTITFLMPERYRILTAALLSIVLGLVLALGKTKQNKTKIL